MRYIQYSYGVLYVSQVKNNFRIAAPFMLLYVIMTSYSAVPFNASFSRNVSRGLIKVLLFGTKLPGYPN